MKLTKLRRDENNLYFTLDGEDEYYLESSKIVQIRTYNIYELLFCDIVTEDGCAHTFELTDPDMILIILKEYLDKKNMGFNISHPFKLLKVQINPD